MITVHTVCTKCGKNEKNLYKVVEVKALNTVFCRDCYNTWFDIRDKIVADAFREYVEKKK